MLLRPSLPKALPCLQPVSPRRTSGQCLKLFTSGNLSLFLPINVIFLNTLPPVFLLSHSFIYFENESVN